MSRELNFSPHGPVKSKGDCSLLGAGADKSQIHVWFASASLFDEVMANQSIFSADEWERAARFYFDKDRALYLCGKYMIRTLLGRILGVLPEELVFTAGKYGKPMLARPRFSNLSFNLAHSETRIACAVGFGRDVGIDIEFERENVDFLEIASRFFCSREICKLKECSAAERSHLFYRYWTLKEAYLKAEGAGLGLDLTAVDVSRVSENAPGVPCLPAEDWPRGIWVQPFRVCQGFCGATAANVAPWTVRVHPWPAVPATAELRSGLVP